MKDVYERIMDGMEKVDAEMRDKMKKASRYEAVRKLTPLKFGELYRMNIKTGRHFDDLVDDLIAERLTL